MTKLKKGPNSDLSRNKNEDAFDWQDAGEDTASLSHPVTEKKHRYDTDGKKPARAFLKEMMQVVRIPFLGNPVLLLCVVLLFALLFVFVVPYLLDCGASAAIDSFRPAVEQAESETYDWFYTNSYNAAEAAYHVSTDVLITVGQLNQENRLEVLRVSDISYEQTSGNGLQGDFSLGAVTNFFVDDARSLLEVPGYGVFTVDLRAAEFIIDNERQYVLIRVPEPELTQFTIDYENVVQLQFESGGILNDSVDVGVEVAKQQLAGAELKLRQNIGNNQNFYSLAQSSAEKLLTTLVKQLNPKLPELCVEIEFIS